MLRYFIKISILLLAATVNASAQDVEEDEEERPAIVDSAHQFRLGFDVSRLVFNELQKANEVRKSYELELDYYWRRDVYIIAEGGWGNASLNYPDLAYNSSNIFFRAGINKSLLPRMTQNDWDMAFIGLRYGMGFINRSDANYVITDSTWGTVSGNVPGTSLTAHWIELTGGVRVEVAKYLFLGWNMRGKFMVNAKQFTELPPYNIAGYGKGEKNTVFDFNIFLSYAIRWDRKHIPKPKQ